MSEVNELSVDIVSPGDLVTLFSISEGDILEIIIGDDFAPEIEKDIIGKCMGEVIRTAGEQFRIQYIEKRRNKKVFSNFNNLHADPNLKDESEVCDDKKSNQKNVTGNMFNNLNLKQTNGVDNLQTKMLLVLYTVGNSGIALPIAKRELLRFDIDAEVVKEYVLRRKECVRVLMKCLIVASNSSINSSLDCLKGFRKALFRYFKMIVQSVSFVDETFAKNVLEMMRVDGNLDRLSCERLLEKYVVNYAIDLANNKPKQKSGTKQEPVADNKRTKHLQCPKRIEHVPESTIIVAYLTCGAVGSIGCIAIVSEEKEQDAEKGIYWVGRSLAAAIIAAIKTDRNACFEYKNMSYCVKRYEQYKDASKYFEIVSRFCNAEKPQTVFVFEQKNIEHFQSDDFETVTAMIPCSNTKAPVPITVYYEKRTKRYFINETLYALSRQRYGLPYIRLQPAPNLPSKIGFAALRAHSELNLLGYSVSATDSLSIDERHALLGRIIDSGILTKAEIMNHLEWLINTRSTMKNQDNAIAEWKADLWYVSNYNVKTQREIWVENFMTLYNQKVL